MQAPGSGSIVNLSSTRVNAVWRGHRSTPPASRRGYHETSRWKVSPDKCHCGTYEWILEEYEARRAVAGIFKVDYLLVSKPE
jgi:hypothetical protein